jgi:hypothetical protein
MPQVGYPLIHASLFYQVIILSTCSMLPCLGLRWQLKNSAFFTLPRDPQHQEPKENNSMSLFVPPFVYELSRGRFPTNKKPPKLKKLEGLPQFF